MWTKKNRGQYDRSKLRYPSDVTDEEWALIGPLIPPGEEGWEQANDQRARRGQWGDVYSEHRLSVGCAAEGPAAAQHGERLSSPMGRGRHAGPHPSRAYVKCRELAGREASPTAAIIDSQSVKSAEKGDSLSTPAGMTLARRSRARSAVCHEHID